MIIGEVLVLTARSWFPTTRAFGARQSHRRPRECRRRFHTAHGSGLCRLFRLVVRRDHARGVLFLLLITATATPGTGQTFQVPARPTCPTCRVVLEPIAVLGTPQDSTGPAPVFYVTRNAAGQFLVTPLSDFAGVGVYDRSGSLLRTIGTAGEGPGEFRYAQESKVLAGDTLVVIDRVLSRFTVYSPDFSVVSTQRLPFPDDGSIFYNTRVAVLHATLSSPERVGYALHHLVDGSIKRSFAGTGPVLPGRRLEQQRRIAAASSGRIWLAHAFRYHIELWDTAAVEPLRVLQGTRSWFPETADAPSAGRTSINAVWEDENGLVFVLFHIPSTDPLPPASSKANPLVRRDRTMDSRIEVIDSRTGSLVAEYQSTRLLYVGITDSAGLVTMFEEDERTGWVKTTVLNVQLLRAAGDS